MTDMTIKAINSKKAWKDNLLNCHYTLTVNDEVIALCPTEQWRDLLKTAFEIMLYEVEKLNKEEKSKTGEIQ